MAKAKKAAIEIRKGASGRDRAYVGASRIPVADIAQRYVLAQDELIIERLQQWLPTLSKEQIYAAIEYWREHPEQISTVIREDKEALEQVPYAGVFLDLSMSAFAEDWESEEDAIYDDILKDAGPQ